MAKAEADQKKHAEKLAAERKANAAKHQAAVKAKQEAFEKARKAAHEAALAKEAERIKREAAAIAEHKKEMTARRAKFEAKFKNVWSVGPTGCSRFRMTTDSYKAGDELIGSLLSDTLIADVEIRKDFSSRTVSLEGAEKTRTASVAIISGVTSDDRVAELIEAVFAKNPEKIKNPPFDLVVMPLVGGSKEYLKWVKLQT